MKNTIDMYKMAEERVNHYSTICETIRKEIFVVSHPIKAYKNKMSYRNYKINFKNLLTLFAFYPLHGLIVEKLEKEYTNNYKELDHWWIIYLEEQKKITGNN